MTTLVFGYLGVVAGLVLMWRRASVRWMSAGAVLVLGGVLATLLFPPQRSTLMGLRGAESTFCHEFSSDLASWQYARAQGYGGPPTRAEHRRQWVVLSPIVRLAAARCLAEIAPCELWTARMHDADGLTEPAMAEVVRAFESRTTCRPSARERGGTP